MYNLTGSLRNNQSPWLFLLVSQPGSPNLYSKPWKALIDTGTSGTSISARVVKSLGDDLQRVEGDVEVITSYGSTPRPRFKVDLVFGGPMVAGGVYFPGFVAACLDPAGPFDAIIGMDIISQGMLRVGDGTYTFRLQAEGEEYPSWSQSVMGPSSEAT